MYSLCIIPFCVLSESMYLWCCYWQDFTLYCTSPCVCIWQQAWTNQPPLYTVQHHKPDAMVSLENEWRTTTIAHVPVHLHAVLSNSGAPEAKALCLQPSWAEMTDINQLNVKVFLWDRWHDQYYKCPSKIALGFSLNSWKPWRIRSYIDVM